MTIFGLQTEIDRRTNVQVEACDDCKKLNTEGNLFIVIGYDDAYDPKMDKVNPNPKLQGIAFHLENKRILETPGSSKLCGGCAKKRVLAAINQLIKENA